MTEGSESESGSTRRGFLIGAGLTTAGLAGLGGWYLDAANPDWKTVDAPDIDAVEGAAISVNQQNTLFNVLLVFSKDSREDIEDFLLVAQSTVIVGYDGSSHENFPSGTPRFEIHAMSGDEALWIARPEFIINREDGYDQKLSGGTFEGFRWRAEESTEKDGGQS